MEIHPRYVGSALVSDLNRIQGLMLGYVPWWLKDLDLRGGPPGSRYTWRFLKWWENPHFTPQVLIITLIIFR